MSKLRILVADDDPWILRMVTTVLEKRGYEVDTACDGEEALEKAIECTPDLVVTDVMMPNMDGWTLVKILRGRSASAFVPVIFLTALGSEDDRIRGFRLGADDYLPKPFRFEELDLRVAKTIQRTQLLEEKARERLDSATHESNINSPKQPKAGLSGNLSELGISSLLVLLDMEKKNGILRVTHANGDGRSAEVSLKNGSPIVAKISDKSGNAILTLQNQVAIYTILDWTKGGFTFESTAVDCDDQIQMTTTALLMEGARLIDERDAVA
ncbi:MAG: response regulator [Kofleriaceae bacterium]|nr:response regulator [Kofleriaceae bacterium]